MAILLWLKGNWKLAVALGLVAALGVQTYRVQGLKGELALEVSEREARERLDRQRAVQNFRNKERTDAEYLAAVARADAARVRAQRNAAGIEAKYKELAGSNNQGAYCVERGKLNEELAAYAQRDAARLVAVAAELSRRLAQRLSGNAAEGEGVAAAYRACRAYELNRADATGTGEDTSVVGGVANVQPVPGGVTDEESNHRGAALPTAGEPLRRVRTSP